MNGSKSKLKLKNEHGVKWAIDLNELLHLEGIIHETHITKSHLRLSFVNLCLSSVRNVFYILKLLSTSQDVI